MSIQKPTKEELSFWESQLSAAGLGINPHTPHGVRLPDDLPTADSVMIATSVRPGKSLMERERIYTHHAKQDRKKRKRVRGKCYCGREFESRKGTKHCSSRCRKRAERRHAKLPIVSEGTK